MKAIFLRRVIAWPGREHIFKIDILVVCLKIEHSVAKPNGPFFLQDHLNMQIYHCSLKQERFQAGLQLLLRIVTCLSHVLLHGAQPVSIKCDDHKMVLDHSLVVLANH